MANKERKVVGAVTVVFVDDGYDWAAYILNTADLPHGEEVIKVAATGGVKLTSVEAYQVWRNARDKTTLDVLPLRPEKYRD